MWPPAGMASSDLLPIRPGGGPPPWAVQGAGPCILQPQLRGGAGLFWLQMKFKGLKGLPHLSYLSKHIFPGLGTAHANWTTAKFAHRLQCAVSLAAEGYNDRLAARPSALGQTNSTVCSLACCWQL